MSKLRSVVRVAVALVVVVVLAGAGVQVWARANLDTSSVARSIVWLEADVDDHRRFPSRPVAAPATARPLRPAQGPVPELDVVRGPDGDEVRRTELLESSDATAFLVVQGDRLVVEEYYGDSSHDATQTSFSVAKSFMSTLFGVALERGHIASLDEPMAAYLPELAQRDERFTAITLRHLLTMSSGIRYQERGLPWSDDATTYYAPDLRAAALSVEIDEPPGQRFHYNNYNLLLAGMVLERATGQHLATLLQDWLWQPMGAEADGSWSLDSTEHGFEKSESGINGRAVDFARFAMLLRDGGRVAGRQVVPAGWVAEATANDTSRDPAAHYQYWWWIDTERPGRFYAAGNKGQYLYVAPDKDAVIVRMGREYGMGPRDWPVVLRDVADRLPAP